MKIVTAHNDVRTLVELAHYENHDDRTESPEFKRVKDQFHKEGAKCWINNKYCSNDLEIHHNVIEYSAFTEIDVKKVLADHPQFTGIDCKSQMLPLCSKHHRGQFHGIHSMTYPIWVLQKYMTEKALDQFEKGIQEQSKKTGVFMND